MESIIKIGNYTATLTNGVDRFLCPENPPLESRLNQFLDSIRGYSPDRLATYTEAVAKKFNGKILKLDRLTLLDDNDSDLIH